MLPSPVRGQPAEAARTRSEIVKPVGGLEHFAVVLDQVGWFAVSEFGFFIGILVLAYVYIWRKGALEWR